MADNLNLASLWSSSYNQFQRSRARIAEAGAMRRNEIPPHVPAGWDSPDSFRMYLPHATRIGQEIISYASRRAPGMKRAAGPGPMAERTASKVERWLGKPPSGTNPGMGALGELRSGGEALWESLLAHAANDGEFAVLVIPRTAHWSHLLDFEIPDPDNPDSYLIHPYFLRDDDDQGPNETDELEDLLESQHYPRKFNANYDNSAKAFFKYARDAKARRLPFVVDILHPDLCLPIGLDPATGKVDALLVRSEHTARTLKMAGFHFETISGADSQSGWASSSYSSALMGVGTRYTLFALWTPGKVLYQIADTHVGQDSQAARYTGLSTSMARPDGTYGDAMVDLEAEYGLCEVPGGYFYGAHHPDERDPDKKGYPFLYPLLGWIRGGNQMLTNILGHSYKVGFGGWLADVSKIDPALWTELGKPDTVDVHPNKVTYVVGTPVPAYHPGSSPEVEKMVDKILAVLEQQSPAGLTGNGDQAGIAQAIAAAGGEVEIGQVIGGATLGLKRIAECLLEQASAISELTAAPVPVYSTITKDGTRKDLVEVSAKDLQGDFSVEIFFPTKKGSNLPMAQAGYQWMQGEKQAISHYTWLQDFYGEEHPEEEMDRIWVERTLASDQGQQMVMESAARFQGDKELARIAKLKQQGALSPGGMPTAMLPPRSPRQSGMAPNSAGVEMGNPAISSLGGQMAGAMQTGPQAQIVGATGTGAETGMLTPTGGP
jgi:hypothetical protein